MLIYILLGVPIRILAIFLCCIRGLNVLSLVTLACSEEMILMTVVLGSIRFLLCSVLAIDIVSVD